MQYKANALALLCNGTLVQQGLDVLLTENCFDSRQHVVPWDTVFWALKTTKNNGHDFISDMYEKKVRCFIIDHNIDTKLYPEASFILVQNTQSALLLAAKKHRLALEKPILGITGSNGKTIVKEWLYQLMKEDYSIARSPKSFNSKIGVPISLLNINTKNQFAIIEAGISEKGEMQALADTIQATWGVFTHLGAAHTQGFESKELKLKEKLSLFGNAQFLIIEEKHQRKNYLPDIKWITWSLNEANTKANYPFWVNTKIEKVELTLIKNKKLISFPISRNDTASLHNTISCIIFMHQLNYSWDTIARRLEKLKPISMRLEMQDGINNCAIINDAYSNDLDSLRIAIDFQHQQRQFNLFSLVLSDMEQSGDSKEKLIQKTIAYINTYQFHQIVLMGKDFKKHIQKFRQQEVIKTYSTTEAYINDFNKQTFNNECILIKGARSFAFEKIADLLRRKTHHTTLEINLDAIAHNLSFYQTLLKPNVKTMAMVKALSYGSGSYEIASLLQNRKIDYLAVAYTDEGIVLRQRGISTPIMIMNVDIESYEMLWLHNLEPECYSFQQIFSIIQFLKNKGVTGFPIHIKLDTGMHRLGFVNNEIDTLGKILQEQNTVKVVSVLSHLACSDNTEQDEFTKQQSLLFESMTSKLQSFLSYSFIKHIANTTAVSRLPYLQYDMVRLGIGLYGIDNNIQTTNQLQVVSTLKSYILQIQKVSPPETIGYSRKGILQEDTLVGTVAIGYADGYPRCLSAGKGMVNVNDILCPIIGNVCMDMIMINLNAVPNAKVGDEVILFGSMPHVNTVASWADTIAYEILTGVSSRVKRIYFKE